MNMTPISGSHNSFETIASWLLVLAVPVSVVFFIPSTTLPMLSTKITLLVLIGILAFAAYIISRLIQGSLSFPPLSLLGSLWFVPIAYVLSTLFSGVTFSKALFGVDLETDTLGFVVLLAVLTSLTALALKDIKQYKLFFQVGVVAVSLVLLTQLFFIVGGKFNPSISAATNVVGSFTDLGMLVGLGVGMILLSLRFFSHTKFVRITFWLIVLVGLLMLVIVNSNVVWSLLALLSAALFIESVMSRRNHVPVHAPISDTAGAPVILRVPKARANTHRLVMPLICLVVALFFVFFDGSSTNDGLANKTAGFVGISVIDVRPSWTSTFLVGSHTLASSPLFGSGPATFGQEWLKFKDRSLNDTIFWNIDFTTGIGYIPTAFITTGVVGALAWVFFLGTFLLAGVRVLLFRLPEENFARFTTIASYIGAFFVLILAFLASPGPLVLAAGFMMLGVCISTLRFARGKRETTITFSEAPRVGFVLVFFLTLLLLGSLGTGYAFTDRYLGSLAYTNAVVALSNGDIARAETKTAQSLTHLMSKQGLRLASAVGIERMRQIANDPSLGPSVAQEQFQSALSNALSAALEATKQEPNDYQNWTVLGNVYQSVTGLGIEGAYEGARVAYEKAVSLNPTSPVLPYVLAQLEFGEKNLPAAEAYVLSAVNLKRDYIPAILFLSQLEIQLGKAQEALQAVEAAAYFAPNDPAVLLQVGLLRLGTADAPGAIAALTKAVSINPQYANARFFLAAMYAREGNTQAAIKELQIIAAFSNDNSNAVADDLSALESGRNPFTQARLRSLGVPQPPVSEPEESAVE